MALSLGGEDKKKKMCATSFLQLLQRVWHTCPKIDRLKTSVVTGDALNLGVKTNFAPKLCDSMSAMKWLQAVWRLGDGRFRLLNASYKSPGTFDI